MKLTMEDQQLLEELCGQHGGSAEKVLKLLNTVQGKLEKIGVGSSIVN